MHVGSTPPIVGLVGDPFIVGVVSGVRRSSEPPMLGVGLGVGGSSGPPMSGVGLGVGGSSVLRHGYVCQRR